jgi:hypothetical protein
LAQNIETVVHGKHDEIKLVLCALVSQGHVLLEDLPGTAKTVLARTIAHSIGAASTNRIQCTPDLQPTDVTGLGIFDSQTREFEFRPGPVFANVVLIDEINRGCHASSLLEDSREPGHGRRRDSKLPWPFLVLAIENPLEHAGTFPPPEAQLTVSSDRARYLTPEHELRIVRERCTVIRSIGSTRSSRSTRSPSCSEPSRRSTSTLRSSGGSSRQNATRAKATPRPARRCAERCTRARARPRSQAARMSSLTTSSSCSARFSPTASSLPGRATDSHSTAPPQECLEQAPKPSVNGQRLALVAERVAPAPAGGRPDARAHLERQPGRQRKA